jgi:hypothetical protein
MKKQIILAMAILLSTFSKADEEVANLSSYQQNLLNLDLLLNGEGGVKNCELNLTLPSVTNARISVTSQLKTEMRKFKIKTLNKMDLQTQREWVLSAIDAFQKEIETSRLYQKDSGASVQSDEAKRFIASTFGKYFKTSTGEALSFELQEDFLIATMFFIENASLDLHLGLETNRKVVRALLSSLFSEKFKGPTKYMSLVIKYAIYLSGRFLENSPQIYDDQLIEELWEKLRSEDFHLLKENTELFYYPFAQDISLFFNRLFYSRTNDSYDAIKNNKANKIPNFFKPVSGQTYTLYIASTSFLIPKSFYPKQTPYNADKNGFVNCKIFQGQKFYYEYANGFHNITFINAFETKPEQCVFNKVLSFSEENFKTLYSIFMPFSEQPVLELN